MRPPLPPLVLTLQQELAHARPSLAATVARVGVDQFVLTPCVLTLFFTAQSLLEGKGFGEAKRRIETSWWPTIQANWGSASLSPPRLNISVTDCRLHSSPSLAPQPGSRCRRSTSRSCRRIFASSRSTCASLLSHPGPSSSSPPRPSSRTGRQPLLEVRLSLVLPPARAPEPRRERSTDFPSPVPSLSLPRSPTAPTSRTPTRRPHRRRTRSRRPWASSLEPLAPSPSHRRRRHRDEYGRWMGAICKARCYNNVQDRS